MVMRAKVALLAIGLTAGAAFAQQPPAVTPQNPGASVGPLGGYVGRGFAPSNNPGSGSGDFAGPTASLPNGAAAKGMPKGEYGIDLGRRIADAQKLVDAVAKGKILTASDTRRIRNLMREDFVAWNKRYDLLPSAYRAERDRWMVDEQSLTPNAWAKQRLDWLQAQREWILAHGG